MYAEIDLDLGSHHIPAVNKIYSLTHDYVSLSLWVSSTSASTKTLGFIFSISSYNLVVSKLIGNLLSTAKNGENRKPVNRSSITLQKVSIISSPLNKVSMCFILCCFFDLEMLWINFYAISLWCFWMELHWFYITRLSS